MTKLNKALTHWGHEDFKKILKQELENLPKDTLPLNEATCQGGQANDSNISALINKAEQTDTHIHIHVGIFFNEIIAGCNCGDDPMQENTYCELRVSINKKSAETVFNLVNQNSN
jgi:hypothetical protein